MGLGRRAATHAGCAPLHAIPGFSAATAGGKPATNSASSSSSSGLEPQPSPANSSSGCSPAVVHAPAAGPKPTCGATACILLLGRQGTAGMDDELPSYCGWDGTACLAALPHVRGRRLTARRARQQAKRTVCGGREAEQAHATRWTAQAAMRDQLQQAVRQGSHSDATKHSAGRAARVPVQPSWQASSATFPATFSLPDNKPPHVLPSTSQR